MIGDDTETSIAPQQTPGEQKPRSGRRLGLRYGAEFWGEDDQISVHMTYPTFNRHVGNYLQSQGIVHPTSAQIIEAACHLGWVAYWHTCTDPDVEIIKKVPGNRQ